MERGEKAIEQNKKTAEAGVGKEEDIRPTDLDSELARNRYRLFKETTYDALSSLRKIFHFHFIDAEKSIGEVQEMIEEEFSYQSSLELFKETTTGFYN